MGRLCGNGAVAVILAVAMGPSAGVAQNGSVDRAIAAARTGGTTIVCRHAITGSFREREPVDYGDASTQRRLSGEGERQSRRLGRALRDLGVRVSEVVASPMQRARRTASLMMGREPEIELIWHTNGGSYQGPDRDARLAVLATPVADGNRLIVSHVGTMKSVLPDSLSIGEGDCVVVRADEGEARGFHVVGVVPWEAWDGARASQGNRMTDENVTVD